ncbi:hypothetical protein ACT7C1_32820 [Bacillus paranthracis]
MKMKHDRNWNALLDLQLQGEKKIQVLNFVMERLDAKNQLHLTQKRNRRTNTGIRTYCQRDDEDVTRIYLFTAVTVGCI